MAPLAPPFLLPMLWCYACEKILLLLLICVYGKINVHIWHACIIKSLIKSVRYKLAGYLMVTHDQITVPIRAAERTFGAQGMFWK